MSPVMAGKLAMCFQKPNRANKSHWLQECVQGLVPMTFILTSKNLKSTCSGHMDQMLMKHRHNLISLYIFICTFVGKGIAHLEVIQTECLEVLLLFCYNIQM